MATIQEIRQQYPQYNDLSDQELADGIYNKHYSDMPRDQFNQKIDFSSGQPNQGVMSRIGQDWSNRLNAIGNSQTLTEGAFRSAGLGLGLAVDPFNEAIVKPGMELAGQIPTMGKSTFGDVGTAAAGAVANSAMAAGKLIGQIPTMGKSTFGDVGEAIANNPTVRSIAGYAGDLANFLPAGAAEMAATKATVAGAGKASKGFIAGAASAIAPTIKNEATLKLFKRATEDFGLNIRADQASPTRARLGVQKLSQDLPYSGVDASEEAQRTAWNSKVAETIGQKSDNLGPETITNFLNDSRNKFNAAVGNGTFKVFPEDLSKIDTLEKSLSKKVTNDIAAIVKEHTAQFKNDLFSVTKESTVPGGIDDFGAPVVKKITETMPSEITAQKLASLRSDLIDSLPTVNSQARTHVAEIIDIIDGIAERNVSPQATATLKQVRKEWRNFKTLEPLLEKSPDGMINPTELMNRVSANPYIKMVKTKIGDDDLVDLARIGKKFLPKSGGSDTASKQIIAGTAKKVINTLVPFGTAATTAVSVPAALAVPAVLSANRGFQALNKSNAVIRATIKKSEKSAKRILKAAKGK